ncbi:calcium-binding protein [Lysinibacillus xylanilyticus]|uniref:Calcium-binding protein n=1 Tax=Lysinibacillus xylanilyticus TaxID=582475 RepID=A0A2M9Q799_9BACI|nr:calcium-binding protein [Lysinibacillus xylanilyticus]PJO43933.1 calcium-binding protein [Lysinibacillus xylanilyticus]
MAFTVKTEAEKIFTNLMGTGASRLPSDPVGSDNRADFHGIFSMDPTVELSIQRAGSQLLFLTALYPNASTSTVRTNILARIHRILNMYAKTIANYNQGGPAGGLGPMGLYSAYALANEGKFDYTLAGTVVTRTQLLSYLNTYLNTTLLDNEFAKRLDQGKLDVDYRTVVSTHNYFNGTNHACFALNGIIIQLGAKFFIHTAIKGAGNDTYTKFNAFFNKLANSLRTKFGNTRSNNGLTELCLPMGGGIYNDGNNTAVNQVRGYFPSAGYNALIVMGLNFAARAYRCAELELSAKAPQLRHVVALPTHVCSSVATELANYYRTYTAYSNQAFEIGGPNFVALGASKDNGWLDVAKNWYDYQKNGQESSNYNEGTFSKEGSGFLNLAYQDANDPISVTSYLYSMTWNGDHTLVNTTIGNAIKAKSGTSLSSPYYIASAHVGFKANAGASRVLQGLAGAMNNGVTTLN